VTFSFKEDRATNDSNYAPWVSLVGELTANANTGDDLADHTEHVIWFGESEPLDLSIFD
jgi:DOPA 4,5-dioxygenase